MTRQFEVSSPEEAEAAMRAVVDYNAALHRDKGSFHRRRLGFGSRPAILVIDLANAWTRPELPTPATTWRSSYQALVAC